MSYRTPWLRASAASTDLSAAAPAAGRHAPGESEVGRVAAEGGGFLCVAVSAEERQVAGDAAGERRALLLVGTASIARSSSTSLTSDARMPT